VLNGRKTIPLGVQFRAGGELCSICGGYTHVQEFWQDSFAFYAAQRKDGVDDYFTIPGASRYSRLSGFTWPLIQGDNMDYPFRDPVTDPVTLFKPRTTLSFQRASKQLFPTLPWNGERGGTAPKVHGGKR